MKIVAKSDDGQIELGDDGKYTVVTSWGESSPVSREFVLSAITKYGWEPLVPLSELQ